MKYEVRELNLGDILDHSISLLKDHFKLIAVIVSVLLIPVQVILAVIIVFLSPNPESMQAQVLSGDGYSFTVYFIALFIGILATFLAHSLTQGAITYGIAHAYLGKALTAGDCIRAGLRHWHRLIITAVISGIGIMAGMMLCLIPGIYLVFAWYIIYPILIFEDLPVMSVFGRSINLMRGHKIKAFVIGIVLTLMGFGVSILARLIPGEYSTSLISSVIDSFILAFNCIVVTVLYFSARCKIEGFDLELLAQSIESPTLGRQRAL
jgi:hypothetical protein